MELHDNNRTFKDGTGSFKVILNNIKTIQNNKFNKFFTVRSTITSKAKSINQTIKYYDGLGIPSYRFSPVSIEHNNDIALSIRQAKKHAYFLVEDFKNKLIEHKIIKDVTLNRMLINILSQSKRIHSCSAGVTYVGLGFDGSIYPCHRFFETTDYKMGSIFDDKNIGENKALINVDHRKKCRICSIKYICGGTCYYESRNNYSQIETILCEFNKVIIIELLKLSVFLKTKRPDLLDIYIELNDIKEIKMNSNKKKSIKLNNKKAIFIKSQNANLIDLNEEGILCINNDKYIANVTTMAIWDLLDGIYTAKEIAQEIATVCEKNVVDIEIDIYQEIAKLRELGFIEQVKETKMTND